MSEGQKKADWSIVAALVVVVVILLPILYVLSIGPALVLLVNGRLDGRTFEFVYWPLMVAGQSSSFAKALIQWYAGFWIEIP